MHRSSISVVLSAQLAGAGRRAVQWPDCMGEEAARQLNGRDVIRGDLEPKPWIRRNQIGGMISTSSTGQHAQRQARPALEDKETRTQAWLSAGSQRRGSARHCGAKTPLEKIYYAKE